VLRSKLDPTSKRLPVASIWMLMFHRQNAASANCGNGCSLKIHRVESKMLT